MKKMTSIVKALFFLFIVCMFLPMLANAQPMPDSNDVDTPIDGGLSLLVAAGAIVGARKMRTKRS